MYRASALGIGLLVCTSAFALGGARAVVLGPLGVLAQLVPAFFIAKAHGKALAVRLVLALAYTAFTIYWWVVAYEISRLLELNYYALWFGVPLLLAAFLMTLVRTKRDRERADVKHPPMAPRN